MKLSSLRRVMPLYILSAAILAEVGWYRGDLHTSSQCGRSVFNFIERNEKP